MAVRQHILPRFLLKGFASRTNKREVYTWVYQKDVKCYETNIINVAVGRKFYGEEGEGTADGKITDFEGQFAPLLDQMRSLKHGEDVERSEAAEFVSHMEIRTKHIRDSFQNSVGLLSDELVKRMSNLKDIEVIFPDDHHLQNILLKLPKHARVALLSSARKVFSDVMAATPSMVKEGHANTLSKTVTPELRVQRYRELNWYVYDTDQTLILGDVGVIWEVSDSRRFISITFKADDIKNVFLPISSNRMLVGTSLSQCPEVNAAAINLQIARMSREFFIASLVNNNLAKLTSQIGQESELLDDRGAREFVDNKLKQE